MKWVKILTLIVLTSIASTSHAWNITRHFAKSSTPGLTILNDDTKTTLLPLTGEYLRIGDSGTTSHSLNTNDDLEVTGKLEVDGYAYHDSRLYIGDYYLFEDATYSGTLRMDNFSGIWGPGNIFIGGYATSNPRISKKIDDTGVYGLYINDNNNQGVFVFTTNANKDRQHGHGAQSDPAVFTHSSANVDTDDTEFSTVRWNEMTIGGGKGSYFGMKSLTEEVTIPVGQGSGGIATSGNLAPANSLIMGVATRTTDAPGGGATVVDVGITGGGNADALIDDLAVALGSTKVSAGGNDGTQLPIANGSATTLILTTDANVATDDMKVRVVVYYMEFTAPAS